MNTVVIDASVLLAFYTSQNQALVKECHQLFTKVLDRKMEAIAPEFLKVEIANGLRFSVKNVAERQRYFENLRKAPIKFFSLDLDLIALAMERSEAVKDSVYDAVYHVLAEVNDATFITCDKKYFEKAKMWGSIELLS